MSRTKRIIIASVAAIAAVTVTGTTAFADAQGDYAVSGVSIRTWIDTGATRLGLGYPGQGADIDLFCTDGQNINGDTWWLHNRDERTGVSGWSADAYMYWYQNTGTVYNGYC